MSSCIFLFLPPWLVTSAPQGVTRAGAVMSLAIPVPERTGRRGDSLAHSLWRWGMGHSGVGGLMLEGASEVAGWAPRGALLPQGPLLGVWWAQGALKASAHLLPHRSHRRPLTRLWSVPL